MSNYTHIAERMTKAAGNDPFLLPSTLLFPRDLRGSFDLALYLVKSNKIYLSAMRRLFSYFITRIQIDSAKHSVDDQADMKRILMKEARVVYLSHQIADNWATYGNVFVAKFPPFTRWLIAKETRRAIALDQIPHDLVKYNADTMTYEIPDVFSVGKIPESYGEFKKIRKRASFEFRDKVSSDVSAYYFKMLDPRYVDIDKAHHSVKKSIIYQVPPDAEARIRNNVLDEINTTPRILLEAVKQKKDYKFNAGDVFHFKSPQPEGISDSDWACPEVLLCFDIIYQIMVYRKSDIAVAEEFMTPARMISPATGDVAANGLLDEFMHTVQTMLAARRKDPKVVFASPLPVSMQEFSGNGRGMTAHDIIDSHMDVFFDAIGMPREFFKGTMMLEQTPVMARLFEQQFGWLMEEVNNFLQFVSDAVLPMRKFSGVNVSWEAPSVANTAENQQVIAQMVANRELPRRLMSNVTGVDNPQAARREAIREDFDIQQIQQEEGAKFERRQQSGSMADIAMQAAEQGGAAGGGAQQGGTATPTGEPDTAPNPADTPDVLQQRGQELAQFWLQMHQQQPNSHRTHMMRTEATHPSLYAIAKQAMEKLRSEGASAGRAQAGAM